MQIMINVPTAFVRDLKAAATASGGRTFSSYTANS